MALVPGPPVIRPARLKHKRKARPVYDISHYGRVLNLLAVVAVKNLVVVGLIDIPPDFRTVFHTECRQFIPQTPLSVNLCIERTRDQ